MMNAGTHPHGGVSKHVFWTRTVLTLGVATALVLTAQDTQAAAPTLVDTLRANGDEYVVAISGGYTGEVLLVGVKSLIVYQTVKAEGHTEEIAAFSSGCIYVTDRDHAAIQAIDVSTAELAGKVSLPPGSGPPHMAASSDGQVVYVADELTGDVYRIQPQRGTYQVGSPVRPGSRFGSIALTHDGQRVLIGDYGLGRIVVLATDPFGPLGEIALDRTFPRRISIPPTDAFALITDELMGGVSVVDLAHSVVALRVPLELGAFDTAIAADGKAAYVSVWPARSLFRINLETWRSKQVTTLTFPPGPLDISPDGRYLVVSERLGALEHVSPRNRRVGVALVDTATGRIVRTAEFVGDPHAVRFLPFFTDPSRYACPDFRGGEWALQDRSARSPLVAIDGVQDSRTL